MWLIQKLGMSLITIVINIGRTLSGKIRHFRVKRCNKEEIIHYLETAGRNRFVLRFRLAEVRLLHCVIANGQYTEGGQVLERLYK